MLFQLEAALIIAIVSVIVLAVIMFLIGMKVMQWYAKKKTWDPSLKTAFLVNLVLLLIGIPIGILFSFLFEPNIAVDLLRFGIDIIIGTFLVMILYKKKFEESLVFMIVVEVILFLIALAIGFILGIFLAIIILGVML
jgi:hypothetical protein